MSDIGIDLESIVYYKDDTHYFLMTTKKDSLLKKGVFKMVIHICQYVKISVEILHFIGLL